MNPTQRRHQALAHQTGAYCGIDPCNSCDRRMERSTARAKDRATNEARRLMTQRPRG